MDHFLFLPGLSLLGKFPQNEEISGFLGSNLGNRIFWGNFWGIFLNIGNSKWKRCFNLFAQFCALWVDLLFSMIIFITCDKHSVNSRE